MRQFTSVHDVKDISSFINLSRECKNAPLAEQNLGSGKTIGLLFLNPSLRTRLSSIRAAHNLGAHPIVMNMGSDGWNIEMEDGVIMNGSTAEHIREAAPVISSYCDLIGIRSFANLEDREKDYAEPILTAFLNYATVPVVSLESAIRHPLQSLADMLTIAETNLKKPKICLTWAPHPKALPQAVANSFSEWTLAMNYDLTIACPEGMELDPEFTKGAQLTNNQEEAFADADIIYAKNWSGFHTYGAVANFPGWTVNEAKMKLTNNGKFMHCLPIRRGVVATDQVVEGPNSLILQQAENRIYAAQAVFRTLLAQ